MAGLSTLHLRAQELPAHMTATEQYLMSSYLQSRSSRGFTVPPAGKVRNMAEWEEVQAVVISWKGYNSELSQIVDYAQEECLVVINCSDSLDVQSDLAGNGVPLTNVRFNQVPANSVWIRDYGPNSVYLNDVDSLYIVDWIYNRPRPEDDAIPSHIADYFHLPLYETTQSPYSLIHTGGNFMSDGLGTAFSEKLIIEENPDLDEIAIDSIMRVFMGIERYIKIENLPYDGIHHIDMHMKLLDEETLLVGEFPAGVSDGPQIEANIQYIQDNFPSVFGTPYKIVRIPMVPSTSGNYAPDAYYRTYANGIFINKTYLVPTYNEEYDTTALRILEEALPGYQVIGINAQNMISASGAIHCVTHTIGVSDPLLIVHQSYPDTLSNIASYTIEARIQHNSGIQLAEVFYRTSSASAFQSVSMELTDTLNNIFQGNIPAQQAFDTVQYYIHATANSGKELSRPITAPEGYWDFYIDEFIAVPELDAALEFRLGAIFPNPATGLSCIPIQLTQPTRLTVALFAMDGQLVSTLFSGEMSSGHQQVYLDASKFSAGSYFIRVSSESQNHYQKIILSPGTR